MARQKGFMKFSGTIGDLNFYVTKGVGYVRKAGGGFNGNAIRNKRSMQRVRENASEFGHCSTVKKQYRLALLHFLKNHKDPKLHGRMMTLFTKLKDLDTLSERGKRQVGLGVKTSAGKRLLKQFNFTATGLADKLLAPASFAWSSQTLSFVNLELNVSLFPKDATHVGLQLGVLDFNFDTLESGMRLSDVAFLEPGFSGDFDLQHTLVEPIAATGIAIFSLQFFEDVNGVFYPLATKSSYEFKVIGVM